MRRYSRSRHRILLLLGAGFAVIVAALFVIPGKRPAQQTAAKGAPALDVRAYMVATGVFAEPPPGQETGVYAAAVQAAQNAGSSVAYTIWTDQDSFEAQGWRDIVGVRRVPISRPPKIDFVREVVVLAWPLRTNAPAAILQAPGLTVEAAAIQQHGVALSVAPTSGVVATPVGGGSTLPYALVSIPRNQWPIPVPAPDVPPLVVTLVR